MWLSSGCSSAPSSREGAFGMRNLLAGGKQLSGKPPSGYLLHSSEPFKIFIHMYVLIKIKQKNVPKYF